MVFFKSAYLSEVKTTVAQLLTKMPNGLSKSELMTCLQCIPPGIHYSLPTEVAKSLADTKGNSVVTVSMCVLE